MFLKGMELKKREGQRGRYSPVTGEVNEGKRVTG